MAVSPVIDTTAYPFHRIGPAANITPFTTRAGASFLELLERLAFFVDDTVRREFHATMQRVIDDFNKNIADTEAFHKNAIAVLKQYVDTQLTENVDFVNNLDTVLRAFVAEEITDARGYVDTEVLSARTYVDAEVLSARTYVDDTLKFVNNKTGQAPIQRATITAPYVVKIDPVWPTNHVIQWVITQDAVGGHSITLGPNIEPESPYGLPVDLNPGGITDFTLVPKGNGVWKLTAPVMPQVFKLYGDTGQRATKLSMIPSTNIFPALTRMQSKVKGVRAGTDTLKILCIGDSTTHGNDSLKPTGPWFPTSWPAQAAQVLTDDGIPAQSGFGIAPSYASVGIDGRFTIGQGWSQLKTPNVGFGSGVSIRVTNAATTTGTYVHDPMTRYDRLDVYYTQSGTAAFQATINVSVAGSVVGTITPVNNTGIGKLSITVPVTTSPVTFSCVSGAAIYITSVDCYMATGTIRLSNAGVAGSTTSEWKNDQDLYASLDCIRAYAPDVAIINLGINDSGWAGGGRAVAGVIADLTVLGDAVKATGADVVLSSFVPSADNSDKFAAVQPSYWAEFRKLAIAKNWGYIDMAARYQTFPVASARGWMSDLVHPSATGYRNLGYAVADVLEAVYQNALV